MLLYGTHGIGKSTWAAKSPAPLFLQTEEGLDDLGVDRTPLLKDLGAVNAWISDLLTTKHQYRTVVIDTLDWLERLIFAAVCQAQSKKSIEEIGYAKGYTFALTHWEYLLNSLGHLRDKGMAVILLSHARIVKVEPPDADTYTRYEPDLDKRVGPMLMEWSDEVFFATYQINTIARDEGFNRDRTRAIGTGERVFYTREMPTYQAKRRIVLPDMLPLDFAAYAQHLSDMRPAIKMPPPPISIPPQTGDIDGLINNGSSKPPLDVPAMAGSDNPL